MVLNWMTLLEDVSLHVHVDMPVLDCTRAIKCKIKTVSHSQVSLGDIQVRLGYSIVAHLHHYNVPGHHRYKLIGLPLYLMVTKPNHDSHNK